MNDTEDISRKVDDFIKKRGHNSVVCFDFFDTLVTRKVMPEYTKKIASRKLSSFFGQKISHRDIYEKRRTLEAEICAENLEKGHDQDFNLQTLARNLYRHFFDREIIDTFNIDCEIFSELFINIELTVEKQVQQPSANTIKLLKTLKKENVRLLLISDFYIPENYFTKMLEHHGLNYDFERIFVSCDYLRTKGSGRLYDLILQELGLSANNLLMIGDNPHADIKMAEDRGLQSLLIDRADKQNFYEQWEDEQKKNNTLKKQLANIARNEKLAPFQEFSLTIWHFTRKLFEALRSDGVQDVFFLSREGEFLKNLFVQYQELLFGQEIIRSHYLIISRKSSYVASLDSLENESFDKLFKQYSHIAPRDFLLSLNFTENQSRQICTVNNIDYTTKIHNFAESSEYSTILHSTVFQDLYEKFRTTQRSNINKYLSSFGVNFTQDRLNIVDVGWKGSMQDNLYNILDRSIEISGYYLGLLGGGISTETALMKRTGILFSYLPQDQQFFSVYNNNRALFEMMLGASHGSAEGYFLSQDEVNERDNGSLYGTYGSVHVAVAEAVEESELYNSKIRPLQNSIFNAFSNIELCFSYNYQSYPPEDWFAAQHARMVFLPAKREVDFFESLYHLENFGVFEFTTFYSGEKLSLRKKCLNLKAVINDPPLLEIGFWPPVILRHLGIGWYRILDGWKRYRSVFGLRRLWCALRFY